MSFQEPSLRWRSNQATPLTQTGGHPRVAGRDRTARSRQNIRRQPTEVVVEQITRHRESLSLPLHPRGRNAAHVVRSSRHRLIHNRPPHHCPNTLGHTHTKNRARGSALRGRPNRHISDVVTRFRSMRFRSTDKHWRQCNDNREASRHRHSKGTSPHDPATPSPAQRRTRTVPRVNTRNRRSQDQRTATADTTLGGCSDLDGEKVVACLTAASFDPAAFPDPPLRYARPGPHRGQLRQDRDQLTNPGRPDPTRTPRPSAHDRVVARARADEPRPRQPMGTLPAHRPARAARTARSAPPHAPCAHVASARHDAATSASSAGVESSTGNARAPT